MSLGRLIGSQSIPLAASLVWASVGFSCASDTMAVTGTPRAADALGSVQVERIEGGKWLAVITMRHMPSPTSMSDVATTYVVWSEDAARHLNWLGSLTYDQDSREATATVVAAKPISRLTITAEPTAHPETPSDTVVAQTNSRN